MVQVNLLSICSGLNLATLILTGNAEGNGTDFVSDTLIALFNPGVSQVNVSLPIIMDRIFDPNESFRLTLTVPDEFSNLTGRVLVKPGSNGVAVGEIIESSGTWCVTFVPSNIKLT